jgi:hypothetical protein
MSFCFSLHKILVNCYLLFFFFFVGSSGSSSSLWGACFSSSSSYFSLSSHQMPILDFFSWTANFFHRMLSDLVKFRYNLPTLYISWKEGSGFLISVGVTGLIGLMGFGRSSSSFMSSFSSSSYSLYFSIAKSYSFFSSV